MLVDTQHMEPVTTWDNERGHRIFRKSKQQGHDRPASYIHIFVYSHMHTCNQRQA